MYRKSNVQCTLYANIHANFLKEIDSGRNEMNLIIGKAEVDKTTDKLKDQFTQKQYLIKHHILANFPNEISWIFLRIKLIL